MRLVLRHIAIIFLATWAQSAIAAELSKIGGVVNYVASSGTVIVNSIPVTSFAVDKYGSGGTGVDLTDWLNNGSNQITLTVKPVGAEGKATFELKNFGSGETLLSLTQEGAGEKSGSIEVTGIPEWAWINATPVTTPPDGLMAAVGDLYDAYSRSDVDRIIRISAAFFTDQEKLGGLTAERFSGLLAPMLKAGRLEPLPETTITSHADDRLFRVVGSDGYPPIRVEMNDDGMKQSMRMGEWWSMINGTWQVVR